MDTQITTTTGTWIVERWYRSAQPLTLTAETYEGPAALGGYRIILDGDLVGYCGSPLEASALVYEIRTTRPVEEE